MGKGEVEVEGLPDAVDHDADTMFLLEFDKVAFKTIEGTTCYQHPVTGFHFRNVCEKVESTTHS